MQERGFVVAGARILRRVWTVYVAHVFIFVIFMAQIAYVTASQDNPLYSEEMRAFDFLQQPGVALMQALILKFQPNFMDVLPLYIVLLIALPLVLWLMPRQPTLTLVLSVLLWAAVQRFYWNLPAYPTGTWFFNPLAWQLIFVTGAWCAVGGSEHVSKLVRSRLVAGIAIAFLDARIAHRDDVVFPALRFPDPEARAGLDVPDRQEQSRSPAFPAFPGAGGCDRALRSQGMAGSEIALAQADGPVRPALAGNLLPRDSVVVYRSLCHFGGVASGRNPDIDQRVRDNCHGRSCVADYVVQHHRGARFRESFETAADGPRGRRGMKSLAGL